MQKINDFVNWGLSSGFFVVLVWFLWDYVKPLLDAKIEHAKTMQEKVKLEVMDKLATDAVTSLVSRTDITGHDKFKAATTQVRNSLATKGLSATEGSIQTAVQAAYEKSDLTPTVKPIDDLQTGVVSND